ncbi:MAG TPA: glycosyltransferase family 4 protein [Candidatus Methylacidiphilales bacterium]|jgi:glycosyltransferase involved in cell wall biosynthesis|nr:glycosyltransferase family 4 protein [Candidatus Methylacidiphilales bacterium]
MKIALLHYSTWPEMGGVENVVRDQANMLVNAGHEVQVLAGSGRDAGEGWKFVPMPQLAPDFDLNKTVRAVLERGQSDQNFSQYRSMLAGVLEAALAGVDVTFVHNIFTMHSNLACTQALHDLASRRRMIAWTHDLTATNSDFALPNPTQPPWNLMRTSSRDVTYVATSDLRAAEIKAHLKPTVEPGVIPNMVDPARLFGLTREIREVLPALEIPWRDFVFLLPARVMVRKNIDFAIEVVKKLREQGRNPLLLVTGAKVPDSPASEHYGAFLRQSLPEDLRAHVYFISDYFAVRDATLRDLYLLSDCLLFPSRQEGFGLPVLEAAMHRMPVWCHDIPSFRALQGSGSFLLNDLAKLPEAVAWLEAQSPFRQQRRCRRLFDPAIVHSKYYEPLLNSLFDEKKA